MSTTVTTYDLPLNTLKRAFEMLVDAADPLCLDGAEIGEGLPARLLEPAHVKALLMSRRTSQAAKRGLWAAVIARSQAGQAGWSMVAAGLAYPGLVAGFRRACGSCEAEDVYDVQAEIVTEFFAALGRIDVHDPAIADVAGWLSWQAVNATKAFRESQATSGAHCASMPGSAIPLFPAGHPDIVLARAVRTGVLTDTESEIIGRLYLEDQRAEDVAAALSIPLSTFYRHRNTAAARLAEAIEDGVLRTF